LRCVVALAEARVARVAAEDRTAEVLADERLQLAA